LVQFSVYGRKCPREEPSKPKVVAELEGDQYLEIPLELIYWKETVREVLKQQDIIDMASSLRLHQQIEPIVVKPPDEEGGYEGVIGRLRFEGAKHAHLKTILARVHQFESIREVREWQLVENLHRRQLSELERDEGYRELYDLIKQERSGVYKEHIVKDMAKKVEEFTGERPSEKTIWKRIQIARELPEGVKKTVKSLPGESFGVKHAEQLLRLKDDPDKQLQFAEEFAATVVKGKPMTVKNLKKKVDNLIEPPKPKGSVFTCFFCGAKLNGEKLRKRIREVEEDPVFYSVVKDRYGEVFNIDEKGEDG
jgi:ParB/RepB/Spo0J family partition protein